MKKPRKIRVTDMAALAAYEGGKFVDTETITTVKHTPIRSLIWASFLLGKPVPGVEISNSDADVDDAPLVPRMG